MYAAAPHLKQAAKLLDFMPPWYELPDRSPSPEDSIGTLQALAERQHG